MHTLDRVAAFIFDRRSSCTVTPPREYPNFQSLLGHRAWRLLPEAIRRRFNGTHGRRSETIYAGVMTEVRASRIGLLLARVCTLFGTPVVPFVGRNVPVFVRLFNVPDKAGVAWERMYRFPNQPICAVRSVKLLSKNNVLTESLGYGLSMPLKVCVKYGELRFVSQGYYFQWGPIRLPLPRWFPPGTTTVIHRDLGDGQFCFILQTDHPWFGEMFYQEGYFSDGDA